MLVVMGGFLKRITMPDDFANRVMNIHPALMPAFCGEGFYGHHVHEAVLEYGAKLSGCTVHFADNQYDHGPVILQKAVPVLDDDTADTLAARVFAGRVRGLSRGAASDRRRPGAGRRPAGADSAGLRRSESHISAGRVYGEGFRYQPTQPRLTRPSPEGYWAILWSFRQSVKVQFGLTRHAALPPRLRRL